MRRPQRDEHVVQVGLVGPERRRAPQYPREHDPQRIENRNAQDCQRKGNQSHLGTHISSARRTAAQRFDDEDRDDDSHDKRSAVADEHFRGLAENIVQKKRNQRADRNDGQNRHFHIARQVEQRSEHRTGRNAVTRRKPVDTVDQVDGIDNAHRRNDRQRNSDPAGKHPHTP